MKRRLIVGYSPVHHTTICGAPASDVNTVVIFIMMMISIVAYND